jgi:hypothetical protein
MLPTVATPDFLNRSRRNTKPLTDRLVGLPEPLGFSDCSDVILNQLRVPVTLSARDNLVGPSLWMSATSVPISLRLPTLLDAITPIIGTGSEEEVGGVDTVSDVAMMQNSQSIRNRSVREFPGDTVGNPKCEVSVPLVVGINRHQPADFGTSRAICNDEYILRNTFETGDGAKAGRVGIILGAVDTTRFAAAFTVELMDDHEVLPSEEELWVEEGRRPEETSRRGGCDPRLAPHVVYHGR